MSTHEQLQSENKTLHTDLQALTATISSQGARIAELEGDVGQLRLIAEAAYKEGLTDSIKELSCLDPDNPLTVDQAWKQSTAWQHVQWDKEAQS